MCDILLFYADDNDYMHNAGMYLETSNSGRGRRKEGGIPKVLNG